MYPIDQFIVLRFVIFQVNALNITFKHPTVPIILFKNVIRFRLCHKDLTSKRNRVKLLNYGTYKNGKHHCYQVQHSRNVAEQVKSVVNRS